MDTIVKTYHLTIDNNLLAEYKVQYFKVHPRAKKFPIEKPRHPSMNKWMILPRIQMNALKQQWKDFGVWWMNKEGLSGLKLDKFEIISKTYLDTRRRTDVDNYDIKFLADAFIESGFIVDDSYEHLVRLILECGYDKDNPRTEITVNVLNEGGE